MVFKDSAKIPSKITGEVLNGLNYGYKSTFSVDGQNLSVNLNSFKSDLHYQISSTKTRGNLGYGKYTTVLVTGKDDKSRMVHRTVSYFNNLFINSRFTLSTPGGSIFYTSESKKIGSQIYEIITGKISSSLSFNGRVQTALDFKNGQQLYKNSTLKITYFNKGTIYGTTNAKLKFLYRSFNGNYSLMRTVSNSTTYYNTSQYTKTSLMNFNYQRNNQGKLVGLQITGNANVVQNGDSNIYKSTIKVQTRKDAKDLYSESFHPGNYFEKTVNGSTNLNKTIPLYESLIL